MPIAEELVAGVVSSVLAVVLVEIYLWLRRRYRQRALRWLVGTDTAAVITPVYPWAENSHPAGLLTTYDAIGLAHVLEACNRVGTVPVVSRSGDSAENAPLDVIAIGGPSGNQVTSTFLKAYCPGFEIITDPETGHLSYRCGEHTFTRSDDETFAFIVRLSPRDTGLPGTALMVWGHSAVSTASAGYYVARYAPSLRKVGKGSFFVAISVRWVLGYRSFDTRPIDLTKTAFAEPVPAAGRGDRPASSLSSGSGSPSRGSRSPGSQPSGFQPSGTVSSGSTSADSSSGGRVSGVALGSGASASAAEPVGEPAPKRRFGRSPRPTSSSEPVGSSPAAAPSGRPVASGRSRVAEALDDVRAAETTTVITAPPSGPPAPSTGALSAAAPSVGSQSADEGPDAAPTPGTPARSSSRKSTSSPASSPPGETSTDPSSSPESPNPPATGRSRKPK